jgi:hypothetical protein
MSLTEESSNHVVSDANDEDRSTCVIDQGRSTVGLSVPDQGRIGRGRVSSKQVSRLVVSQPRKARSACGAVSRRNRSGDGCNLGVGAKPNAEQKYMKSHGAQCRFRPAPSPTNWRRWTLLKEKKHEHDPCGKFPIVKFVPPLFVSERQRAAAVRGVLHTSG